MLNTFLKKMIISTFSSPLVQTEEFSEGRTASELLVLHGSGQEDLEAGQPPAQEGRLQVAAHPALRREGDPGGCGGGLLQQGGPQGEEVRVASVGEGWRTGQEDKKYGERNCEKL